MFSVENLYYILYSKLLEPSNIIDAFFWPFGSTAPEDLYKCASDPGRSKPGMFNENWCLFYDQEPIMPYDVSKLIEHSDQSLTTRPGFDPVLGNIEMRSGFDPLFGNVDKEIALQDSLCLWGMGKPILLKLLANSEHSGFKNEMCIEHGFLDFYYFYHGFAALDWYRDMKYLKNVNYKFDKTFINLNRLCKKERSYRLQLVAEMLERKLLDKGHVSLQIFENGAGILKTELVDSNCLLSKTAKIKIYSQLGKLQNNLTLDNDTVAGSASAKLGLDEHRLLQSGLWHIVSETVFYHKKLHLTEKIFKPIVTQRPFILVAAPGNLAYLKSYGFKTFDKWIDESYDHEEDNDKRIQMIVDQIEKLSSLSYGDTMIMYEEMQQVLEYNFDHFYGEFRNIIVNELVDNFENCLHQWNALRDNDSIAPGPIRGSNDVWSIAASRYVDVSVYDFSKIKQDFLS